MEQHTCSVSGKGSVNHDLATVFHCLAIALFLPGWLSNNFTGTVTANVCVPVDCLALTYPLTVLGNSSPATVIAIVCICDTCLLIILSQTSVD